MYDGPHQFDYFKKLQRKAGLRDDQFIPRVRWLPPEEHFGITLSNRAGKLEIKDLGIAALKKALKKPCYYPFYQILIDYDGNVLLCAHDWGKKLIAGNINTHSILEIWNNNIMKKVRINLIRKNRNFPPCNFCDVQGILIGRSHFNKWTKYYENRQSIDQ